MLTELGAMLLDLIIDMHAWAAARPKHESEVAAQRLEQDIKALIEVEEQQGRFPSVLPPNRHSRACPCLAGRLLSLSKLCGMPTELFTSVKCPPRSLAHFATEKTRERLVEFITRMKTALAALAL